MHLFLCPIQQVVEVEANATASQERSPTRPMSASAVLKVRSEQVEHLYMREPAADVIRILQRRRLPTDGETS